MALDLIYERIDNEKPYVVMTNFKRDYVTMNNVKIEKNSI